MSGNEKLSLKIQTSSYGLDTNETGREINFSRYLERLTECQYIMSTSDQPDNVE